MKTAKEMHPDVYPFKEGDEVFIKWSAPRGATDTGTIHKLCIGTHFDKPVIYSILVKIDGHDKPVGASADCIFPLADKNKYTQGKLFPE